MWVCPLCQSKKRQVECCSLQRFIRDDGYLVVEVDRTICEHSLHRVGRLTGHLQHMVKKHGWKVPGFK